MKKMKISSSKMDSYDWCQRKWRIKEIDKIPSGVPPHPALILGKVCHKEIDNFWDRYNLDLDNYAIHMQNYYTETVKRINRLNKLYGKNYVKFQLYFSNFINFQIRRIDLYIKNYGKNYETIKKLFFPILTEVYGKFSITDDIIFGFIIDSLFWNPTGNILIDWKSDKLCTEAQFESHVPQLNRYTICLLDIGYSCEKIGIYFLKDSIFFNKIKTAGYSLKKEVLAFIRKTQISKFPKVPKKEKWKCHNKDLTYVCEYYPEICTGVK